MRLKTVQVHGFKTFAHPTTFHFGDGITAIVGPNGCGKSNIADAIRWALGEQSPSNLRTKKTEDLIFTGSATRPKMGMAEVALTLENPFSLEETAEPIEHSGNGNSGSPVVRPEPVLRSEGSAVKQSSIVEEILRVRPSEVTILRRAYRSGENEYLINRQRVRLRDVQELLQRWGLARLTYAVIGQGLIDQALSLRAEERRALFEEAAGIGLYQNKKANALEKLEETRQNLIRVNDIINEIAPRLPSLARQADRAGKYQAVSTALNAHLKQWYAYNWARAQEGFLNASEGESAAREKLAAQRALMQDLASRLTDARRTAQNLRARLAEHRRAQQQRETELASQERELAVLQERARAAETQHADALRDLESSAAAVQAALSALEQFSTQPPQPEPNSAAGEPNTATLGLDQPTIRLSDQPTDQQADPFLETRTWHQAEIQALTEQQRAADIAHDTKLETVAASERAAELEWTTQAERASTGYQETDAAQQSQFEQDTARLAQERELAELARARAMVRERLAKLRQLEFAPPTTGTLAPAAPPDLASHLISLQDKLPLYESALAHIAGLAARADDLARQEQALRAAERLAERARQEAVETQANLALVERDLQTAHQAELALRREHERAERERAQERERARRDRLHAQERAREHFQREREKLNQERDRRRREIEQQIHERELLLKEAAREQEREQARARQRAEEQALAAAREQERLQRERVQEQERLTREHERVLREQETRSARVAAYAAQIAELTTALTATQSRTDEMRSTLQSLNQVAFPDEAALNESEHLQNELEEQEGALRSGLTVAEELYNRAVLEAERRRAEIARLEQEIEDDLGPVDLDSAAPRQLRLRLTVASPNPTVSPQPAVVESESDSDTPPSDLMDDEPEQEIITLPDVEFLPDGFDKEIRRLKNQMRYIGNVNPNAPQEYAELKERHSFLTEQALDLTQAIEKLQQATAELDAMMKAKFVETFDAINLQFRMYFSILFGGGSGRLELTDPNDIIHTGIEIVARPPGKRAATLVLLSGGERALTAAALIFAILKVSPTPFCVMDEVDAALDEANVGRFRDGLQELSDASQFIVITHNRVTMEGAQAIYGVSMGEDGVSQVLSLKLEQAGTL